MKIICSAAGTGKTHDLVKWVQEIPVDITRRVAKRIIVCYHGLDIIRFFKEYHLNPNQIFRFAHLKQDLQGCDLSDVEIAFDDMDEFLLQSIMNETQIGDRLGKISFITLRDGNE